MIVKLNCWYNVAILNCVQIKLLVLDGNTWKLLAMQTNELWIV